jgi:hypothetical protein
MVKIMFYAIWLPVKINDYEEEVKLTTDLTGQSFKIK